MIGDPRQQQQQGQAKEARRSGKTMNKHTSNKNKQPTTKKPIPDLKDPNVTRQKGSDEARILFRKRYL